MIEFVPAGFRSFDSGAGVHHLAEGFRRENPDAGFYQAMLYRELATLRIDAPIPQSDPEELRWRGVDREAFEAIAVRLRAPRLLERVPAR